MALLERVATLIRANLNDLVDRAEDPEKMIRQVVLDMHNQLLQVKTQVAIAIADQHLLQKKQQENLQAESDWLRKAEFAVEKQQEDLARAAIERSLSAHQVADSFAQQVADQRQQVEELKTALLKLQKKLAEAEAKADLLVAQARRSRAVTRAADAHTNGTTDAALTFDRMKHNVDRAEAVSKAKVELLGDDVEDRLEQLEKQEKVEQLLLEIKDRKRLNPGAAD